MTSSNRPGGMSLLSVVIQSLALLARQPTLAPSDNPPQSEESIDLTRLMSHCSNRNEMKSLTVHGDDLIFGFKSPGPA